MAGEPGRRMTQKANRSITGDPEAITMEPGLLVDVEMVQSPGCTRWFRLLLEQLGSRVRRQFSPWLSIALARVLIGTSRQPSNPPQAGTLLHELQGLLLLLRRSARAVGPPQQRRASRLRAGGVRRHGA
jgi:hypothetical protein